MRKRKGLLVAAAVACAMALGVTVTPAYAQGRTVDTAAEFMAAINSQSVDSITLGTSINITDNDVAQYQSSVVVSHDLTIDGQGNTITNSTTSTATAAQRNGLNVTGSGVDVTLRNLTIADVNGSALTVRGGADAELQNVTLDHSTSGYGCGLIISDGSTVTMQGCAIKLNTSSWGGVCIERSGRVTLGNPTVTGDAGKALAYVDNPASGTSISSYVNDWRNYFSGSIDGRPAVMSKAWTVSTQEEFQSALDNAPTGMAITLSRDITVEKNGLYVGGKTNLTIDGGGHSITAANLVNGAHAGGDRSALDIASSRNVAVRNLTVVNNASTQANNGINFSNSDGTLENVAFEHNTSGAALIVAGDSQVSVAGTFKAKLGASSWGVASIDTTSGGGNTKLTFESGVQASYDLKAKPDAPVVYIDDEDAEAGATLGRVLEGASNAGINADGSHTHVEELVGDKAPTNDEPGYTGDTVCSICGTVLVKGQSIPVDVTLYRLYNQYTGEHLFTRDANEYAQLSARGWNAEGVAWVAPGTSDVPVYRLYNPYTGDHHFTTGAEEYDRLGQAGWRQEGIAFYSAGKDDEGAQPLWRLFNPYEIVGTHLYTTSEDEYNDLGELGWRKEGVAWYGLSVQE